MFVFLITESFNFCRFRSTFKIDAKSPTEHSNFKNSDQISLNNLKLRIKIYEFNQELIKYLVFCGNKSSLVKILSNSTLVLLSSIKNFLDINNNIFMSQNKF